MIMHGKNLKSHVFMAIARDLSQLGTCDRKQVGALIVWNGRCITWGYNGAPPGLPHCNENLHGWEGVDGQGFSPLEMMEMNGCINATHAEANALAFAARTGISTASSTLYVTCSPCDVCARLLIAAGIADVWYEEEYRDPAGRELLEAAGVPCRSISAL